MSKVQQILNDEMSRLARKEAKRLLKPLMEKLSVLKKTVQEQNKLLAVLEKSCAVSTDTAKKTSPLAAAGSAKEGKQVRLATRKIVVLRKKLGLTQGDFAKVLGINLFTVSHWEKGKTTPRDAQKRAICALRGMKKRELAKLFAERGISKSPLKTPGRKKGKAAVRKVAAENLKK